MTNTDQAQPLPPTLYMVTVVSALMLAISAWQPYDRLTWLLEVAPVIIVLPVLWATARRFPLTNLLYAGILAHAAILIVGGMYTYARVPLGFELQALLDLDRNPYDKIGHFFQGFVPALAAREILVRGQWVNGRRMLRFLIVCIVLAISASYELLEWAAALSVGEGADEFLGTQGDEWDTQSDMFTALLGALACLLLLPRTHDAQIERLRQ